MHKDSMQLPKVDELVSDSKATEGEPMRDPRAVFEKIHRLKGDNWDAYVRVYADGYADYGVQYQHSAVACYTHDLTAEDAEAVGLALVRAASVIRGQRQDRGHALRDLIKKFKAEAARELRECRDDMPTKDRYDKTARCETYERCAWLLEATLNGE